MNEVIMKNIENKMLAEKEVFCEFLACFYNRGLCDVDCGYQDENNFYYRRSGEKYGINDLFVYCNDVCCFEEVLHKFSDIKTVTVITPLDFDVDAYSAEWKVSFRRQFYKNKMYKASTTAGFTVLDASHAAIIGKSTSEIVKSNYNMAVEYQEDCFALLQEELYCFASVSKNEKTKAVEVTWIYTEPQHRKNGFASKLLIEVSNFYLSNGYSVTYHCDQNNLASANTALKSDFTETVSEIVLEKL